VRRQRQQSDGRIRRDRLRPLLAGTRTSTMILYPAIDLKDGRCVRL
jgi:hypothetical protein